MSEDQKPKYISLWDVVARWDQQGKVGIIKQIIWAAAALGFIFVLLPIWLMPLLYDNTGIGKLAGAIIWIAVVVTIHILGHKLKVKVD